MGASSPTAAESFAQSGLGAATRVQRAFAAIGKLPVDGEMRTDAECFEGAAELLVGLHADEVASFTAELWRISVALNGRGMWGKASARARHDHLLRLGRRLTAEMEADGIAYPHGGEMLEATHKRLQEVLDTRETARAYAYQVAVLGLEQQPKDERAASLREHIAFCSEAAMWKLANEAERFAFVMAIGTQ